MNRYDQPSPLTEGAAGTFYTESGSTTQVVFAITAKGVTSTIASFAQNQEIAGLLVAGPNGRFYDALDKQFAVFSVGDTPGRDVYTAQGIVPFLTQNLPNGTLLGTGYSTTNAAYIVTSSVSGVVTPVYAFSSGEILPNTLISATDRNYYGFYYLHDGSGHIYRVTPSGAFSTIWNSGASTIVGNARWVPLLQASDGNLYGTTPNGGANGTGTIYKLSLSGEYTLLYQFPKGVNYNPSALIEGSDGNLYGATIGSAGESLLFRITKSGQYTLLHTMVPYPDGQCQCQLTQGSDGVIYGTAVAGGVNGAGVYFALDVGLAKPAPRAQEFNPQSGSVGTQVLIWGFNLLSASVEFNGVPATAVKNSGANYVFATVPAGAASGPITVTTPGGAVTTTSNFTVQ